MKILRNMLLGVAFIIIFSNSTYAMQGDYAVPSLVIKKFKQFNTSNQKLKENSNVSTVKISDISKENSILREFVYNPKVAMPIEHQEYLFNMTKKRGLDYLKTLALLKHESQYDQNIIAVNDYGYMQINSQNHLWLSRTLLTVNNPLDPYVNINWGTYMLSDFYDHWESKGVKELRTKISVFNKLERYAMSSYNKGINGFINHGEAMSYLEKVEREYEHILEIYEDYLN